MFSEIFWNKFLKRDNKTFIKEGDFEMIGTQKFCGLPNMGMCKGAYTCKPPVSKMERDSAVVRKGHIGNTNLKFEVTADRSATLQRFNLTTLQDFTGVLPSRDEVTRGIHMSKAFLLASDLKEVHLTFPYMKEDGKLGFLRLNVGRSDGGIRIDSLPINENCLKSAYESDRLTFTVTDAPALGSTDTLFVIARAETEQFPV